jgi:hypothetical protein
LAIVSLFLREATARQPASGLVFDWDH